MTSDRYLDYNTITDPNLYANRNPNPKISPNPKCLGITSPAPKKTMLSIAQCPL